MRDKIVQIQIFFVWFFEENEEESLENSHNGDFEKKNLPEDTQSTGQSSSSLPNPEPSNPNSPKEDKEDEKKKQIRAGKKKAVDPDDHGNSVQDTFDKSQSYNSDDTFRANINTAIENSKLDFYRQKNEQDAGTSGYTHDSTENLKKELQANSQQNKQGAGNSNTPLDKYHQDIFKYMEKKKNDHLYEVEEWKKYCEEEAREMKEYLLEKANKEKNLSQTLSNEESSSKQVPPIPSEHNQPQIKEDENHYFSEKPQSTEHKPLNFSQINEENQRKIEISKGLKHLFSWSHIFKETTRFNKFLTNLSLKPKSKPKSENKTNEKDNSNSDEGSEGSSNDDFGGDL